MIKKTYQKEIDLEESHKYFFDAILGLLISTSTFYSFFWYYMELPRIAFLCFSTGLFITTILIFRKKLHIQLPITSNFLLGIYNVFLIIINVLFVHSIPTLMVYFSLIPICALILLGRKGTLAWIIIALFSIILVNILSEFYQLDFFKTTRQLQIVNTVQTITIFLIVLFLIYLYDDRNIKLIASLSEQNKIIKNTQIAIEETQRYKDNFLSSISHEIRTPMNAIKGISEILLESSCFVNTNGEEKEMILALNNSSIHLLNIINDLLDLGKIEDKKLKILDLDIDLRETITIGTKMVQLAAEQKDIELSIKIDESLPKHIKSDPHRLIQILVNILNNAVKFTNKGKVSLEVNKTIINQKPFIEFIIIDTGIGIAKESQSTIFERFKQSNDYISMKYGGTGLGLNIVKGLVELMHGNISFDSELGQGTTFKIILPLNESDGIYLKTEYDLDEELIGGLNNKVYNILIVDDNNLNLLVAEKLLQKSFKNVNIFKATNGQLAIESLYKFPEINMVLMDLQMPKLDGREATIEIRKEPRYKNLPIIAMSAAINEREIKECLESGMTDFIGKPFDKNSLLMLIKKHIL